MSSSPLTRTEIHSFESNLRKNLRSIHKDLKNHVYEFSPAIGRPIHREDKPPRPIVVAQVRDRVVLRRLLEIIQTQPSMKSLLIESHSYGGIQKRGVRQALEAACKSLSTGANYYIKSDIQEYYRNIPREAALEKIFGNLQDDSLNEILDRATEIELLNLSEIRREYRELFPSHEIGVAQGSCLSPLIGNILLRDFDQVMNSDGVTCIRYIDDFILLGNSSKLVWTKFTEGLTLLRKLGLSAYHPQRDRGKATEGATFKSFEFLGCSISPHFIHPSKNARKRLLANVKGCIKSSKDIISTNAIFTQKQHRFTMTGTLKAIHDILYAWGNQYSFCNSKALFADLDKQIDQIIVDYLSFISSNIMRSDSKSRRINLGIHLLANSKSDPILSQRNR